MKHLPIIAAAVGLLLAAPVAMAQPDQGSGAHEKRGGQSQAHPQARAEKPAQQARARPAGQARPAAANRARNVTRNVHRNVTQNVHRNVTTNVHRNVTQTVHRNVVQNVHRNVTTNAGRNVDITRYRRVVRAERRFHYARPWAPPRGFVYRRFSLGERVPSVLLVADFFLTDFGRYGLVAPPPTYVWVRDGNDAVLVNRYTGEVIQVQYDIFY